MPAAGRGELFQIVAERQPVGLRDALPVPHVARRQSSRGIVGIIVLAVLVALGIWVWPEPRRTIRIHRM
jgi:hypothetical protein